MSEAITRPGCIHCESGDFPLNKAGSVVIDGDGNSTSTSFSWVSNSKDILLWITLFLAVCVIGYAVSKIQYYEDKYETATRELNDENRLKRNHDDQLKIELQAAQTVAVLSRCKP